MNNPIVRPPIATYVREPVRLQTVQTPEPVPSHLRRVHRVALAPKLAIDTILAPLQTLRADEHRPLQPHLMCDVASTQERMRVGAPGPVRVVEAERVGHFADLPHLPGVDGLALDEAVGLRRPGTRALAQDVRCHGVVVVGGHSEEWE